MAALDDSVDFVPTTIGGPWYHADHITLDQKDNSKSSGPQNQNQHQNQIRRSPTPGNTFFPHWNGQRLVEYELRRSAAGIPAPPPAPARGI